MVFRDCGVGLTLHQMHAGSILPHLWMRPSEVRHLFMVTHTEPTADPDTDVALLVLKFVAP